MLTRSADCEQMRGARRGRAGMASDNEDHRKQGCWPLPRKRRYDACRCSIVAFLETSPICPDYSERVLCKDTAAVEAATRPPRIDALSVVDNASIITAMVGPR